MGHRAIALTLSDAEAAELSALAARRNTAQALALRSRIVLACATGEQNKDVAARLGVDALRPTTSAIRTPRPPKFVQ